MKHDTTAAPIHRPHFSLRAITLAIAILSGGAYATEARAPRMPIDAAGWQRAAATDIEAGYRITLDNHPGTYDPANPDFPKNLAYAREQALALAAKVRDQGGYAAALARFNVLIRDGHAGMTTNFGGTAGVAERWPGFVSVWRGDALYVSASEPDGAPVGARVIACDGRPIKELITDNVFAFRGRIDEPGHWWTHARQVFVDRGNPFITLPRRCQFAVNDTKQERNLVWKPMTEQARKWREDSYNGPSLKVGLSEPRPGLVWVAMPTFAPDEQERETYRAMNKEIEEHRQRYLDADAIVIDLRQNQGGSSSWSRDLAGALWGKGRVERRATAYFANTHVWWRASSGNIEHMTRLIDKLTEEKQPDGAKWARAKSAGMQAALVRGEKFYIAKEDQENAAAGDPKADLPGDPAPFTKPVYVVVPGQCASACLDALDVFSLFSNTILIGAPSAADSTYMEVRTQALESGLARVIIPNKVYVNRPRANGQTYAPAIVVKDLEWSTKNMQDAVEAHLKAAVHGTVPGGKK